MVGNRASAPRWRQFFASALLTAVVAGCEQREEPRYPEQRPPGDTERPGEGSGGPGGAEAQVTRAGFPSDEHPVLTVERRAPRRVHAGEDYATTITVKNASSRILRNVVVRESISGTRATDAQATEQEERATRNAKHDGAGEEQTWRIAELGPGEERSFESALPATHEGKMNVCTTATYDQALCTEVEVVKPALGLEAVIVSAEGRPIDRLFVCDEPFILYRVTNPGSAETAPVHLTHSLPEGVKLADGGRQVELELDPIPPGKSVEKRVRLELSGPGKAPTAATAKAGELTARAQVRGLTVLRPELGLRVDGPARSWLGRPITYRVLVENPSDDAPLIDTKVKLALPEGARRVDVSSREVREKEGAYELGTIAPGEGRAFAITFEAPDPGMITAEVTAQAYCAEAATQHVETEVVGVPAIRLEAIDLTDPAVVGDSVVYEVRIKNQGTAEDLDIELSAELPPQLVFESGSGDTEVTGEGQRIRFAPAERLGAGDILSWKVRAKVREAGLARLKVELRSKANPRPVIEEEPTTLLER